MRAGPELEEAWMLPGRWTPLVEGAWAHDEVVHVLEARAEILGLRRLVRQPRWHGRRVLSLGDNMPSLLAFDRGRGKDRALMGLCRRSAALQFGCRTAVATPSRGRRSEPDR